jgi:hypothetical protein
MRKEIINKKSTIVKRPPLQVASYQNPNEWNITYTYERTFLGTWKENQLYPKF